jgi:hypothetical protein
MAIRHEILSGERLRVCHVRIKGQQQRRAFLDKADPGVLVTVNAALVAFGRSEPAFEVEVVLWQVPGVAPDEQPWRKARHHAAHVVPHRISALLQLLLHMLKLLLTFSTRPLRRLKRCLDSPESLHVRAQRLLDVMDSCHPPVKIRR